MQANKLSIPLILRNFEHDAEYLRLQEEKTKMIAEGKHRTSETHGGVLYHIYTPEFIGVNNRLLTLEGLRTWGGEDQHYRLLTPEERVGVVTINLDGKSTGGKEE